MARAIGKLSAMALKSAGPGMHGDGAGLYLCVSKSGARSWIFRFMLDGKAHEMGLGALHTIGLKTARESARRCREQLVDGVNPLGEREARRQRARLDAARAMTFRECADKFIASHKAGWRNPKHAAQWPSTFRDYVFPVFGDLAVQAIDEALVVKALEPIWSTKTETATRVRQRVEAVLDWATVRKFRQGENPARWKGCLESLLPAPNKVRRVAHHAALPYSEIGAFIAELRGMDGVGARALEFAILTSARTGEVIGTRWSEIDLATHIWTVPADRMKAGREHRVPLSTPAVALLEEIATLRPVDADETAFVFPGARRARPISNMAMLMLLRRMNRGELTAHGFRSSFSDWCAERTAFPAEVREMALAHAVGNKVEASYRRGDLFAKRRQVADAWARFCTTPPASGQVVPLRKATSAQ